jgi:hypothetical protein
MILLPMKTSYDPVRVFRNGRREGLFAAVAWCLAMLWTVGYCYLFGYQHGPDSWPVRAGLVEPWRPGQFRQFLGLPHWVLFGIVCPWLFWTVVTWLYAAFGIADDDLGAEAGEEGASHGH